MWHVVDRLRGCGKLRFIWPSFFFTCSCNRTYSDAADDGEGCGAEVELGDVAEDEERETDFAHHRPDPLVGAARDEAGGGAGVPHEDDEEDAAEPNGK